MLGILPTWSFWQRKDVWKSGRVFVAPFAGLLVGLGSMSGLVGVPVLAAIGGSLASYVVGLGMFERYVRRRALRRGMERLGPSSDG
jgi:hypothetical protein